MREPREHHGDLALGHGIAHAFWLRAPGCGEIRPVALPEPGPDDVVVRTMRSGISRGTETLVFRGGVPPDQRAKMRAPFQEGDFPGPVRDGYLNVGAVEEGPPELRGRTVFCLYPHQTAYVVPAGAVTVVPDSVPPARAVLAGTVETAVNALWTGAPLSATGSRSSAQGWSAAASHDCSIGFQPCASPSWMSIPAAQPSRPRSASTSPSLTTPTAAATWSSTRVRRQRGCNARSTCSPRRAPSSTSAGTATRRFGSRWEGRSMPAASASARARSAPFPRSARRASHDGRPPGARPRSAVRSRPGGAPHWRVALRRAARSDGPTDRGKPSGSVPHDHLRRGIDACSA